jgi:hypothetical protein
MSDIEDGGQAFPRPYTDGMSLRDYFAAQAMNAWIRKGAIAEIVAAYNLPPSDGTAEAMGVLAAGCYEVADAMLKERAK